MSDKQILKIQVVSEEEVEVVELFNHSLKFDLFQAEKIVH